MFIITTKKITGLFLCGLISVGFFSCAVRNVMVREVAGVVEAGLSSFEQDDDLDMLEKAFPANIKLMESFAVSSPKDRKALILLSRLYASYAFLFVESEMEALGFSPEKSNPAGQQMNAFRERVQKYYLKGAEYALRALELKYPGCVDRIQRVDTREEFFNALTKEDVPALFWYGFNLGSFVNNCKNSVKALAKANLAEKAMKKVIELEASYFHGAAHLFLLGYYASRSPMMGGKPVAALNHYERLGEIAGPGYLLADLYYARFYLVQKQDRERFREILTGILNFQEDIDKYRLFNKVARTRARYYLNAIDRLFE